MKSIFFKLLSVILISCLGIIVYSNTFHCGFHLDDLTSITDNFAIRNIQDLQSIWGYLPRRFFLYLSIALNYHFNQIDVFGYHLFNLAVHVLTALLVWWLTLLTLSTPVMKDNKITSHANLIALLAGLVFVSHPLQTQAVTYIVQRAASMAALFYVASLCFYVQSRLKEENGSGKVYCILSLITAVMAMFTKETAITLPLMIVLYEISFFKTKQSFKWGYFIPFLIILFIIPVTMLMTETGAVRVQELKSEPGISSIHYLLTQFRVILTYIRLVFVPVNQNLDYDYPVSSSLFDLPTIISFLALMAILFGAKQLYSKYRLISFSIFWFFLTLLPESSFMPIKDVIFEHRLYLPLVGFSIFLVSGAWELLGKNTLIALIMTLTMIIAGNSVLTYQRNKVWKDEFSLWDDTVRKSPHKARPYNQRGLAYDSQGKYTLALSDYNKAIEFDPKYTDAHNNRGLIYYNQGNFTLALSDYNKVILLNPQYAKAYDNRGVIYDQQGKLKQALSDFSNAITLNPNLAKVYVNRGVIYDNLGDLSKAIIDYNKAIELSNQDDEAYTDRGVVYAQQNNLSQAMSDYNEAIELNPKQAESYFNRGNLYYKQGNYPQAIADYSKALELNPKLTDAYNNRNVIYEKQSNAVSANSADHKTLEVSSNDAGGYYLRALTYDKQGNFDQAILNYNKTIELDPKYAEAYTHRGVIYAKQNKITEAIADLNKAIEINPRYAVAYTNLGLINDNQGNPTQAIADLNKAIEIDPNLADAYYNRGNAYSHINDPELAMADYNKVIALDPYNLGVYTNRGVIFAKQNNFTQAIADFTKEIELSPDSSGAYANRGFIYYKLGNYAQAKSDYTKAIELTPQFADAYKIRAVVFYELKEYDNAWADVNKAQGLGVAVDPALVKALKQASGRDQ